MELMQEAKGYSDSREELEEEEEAAEEIITREESSSSSSKHFHYPFIHHLLSSSPSIANHHHHHHHHHNHHHVINIDSPHQPKNQWLGMVHDHNHHHHHHHHESPDATTTTESHQNSSYGLGLHHHQDAASNYIDQTRRQQQQLDFMDLSLGTNNSHESNNFQGPLGGQYGTTTSTSTSTNSNQQQQQQQPAEKEHMFDKVVTPSDVGKLNRLVIPKQHAEKYFPLDSTSNEKGLLLNFEDRNGKLWRFRYSYWNSSQSYVMTKGWSRFVKEKKLDAGDIVSFQRGVGELYRHRLYIDWRRRTDHHHHHGPDPSTNFVTPFFLPNQPHLSQYSIRWGGRFYSLPSPQAPPRHHHDQQHFQRLNYNNMYPFHQQQQQQQHGGGGSLSHHYSYNSEMNSGSGSVYYLRSTTPSMPMADNQGLTRQQQQEGGNIVAPMIIDSVPVAHHHHNHHVGGSGNSSSNNSSTAGKRLRLFGVNMECASSTTPEDPKCFTLLSSHVTMANNSLASSSLPSLQRLRVPQNEEPLSSSSSSARFGDQRGEAAVVFDLDPSLQYHQ